MPRVRYPSVRWVACPGVYVNLVRRAGTFLCTKAAVAQFLQQGRQGVDGIRGRVVNISSQHGMLYNPGSLAYGVSKAAVVYMTRQIAAEYISQGIVVNAGVQFLSATITNKKLKLTIAFSSDDYCISAQSHRAGS